MKVGVPAHLGHNVADLGLKAHVQHAVSLVQDQVCDAPEVGDARVQHVDQAAGRGDDYLHPRPQVAHLRPLGRSSVHAPVTAKPASTHGEWFSAGSQPAGKPISCEDLQ